MRAKAGTPVWRKDEEGRAVSLVITRAGRAAIGVEEIARDLMVWMTFLFFPTGHKKGMNIAVEFAVARWADTLPGKLLKLAYLGSFFEYTFQTTLGPIFVVSPDLTDVLTVGADVSLIFDTPVDQRYDSALELLGLQAWRLSPQAGRA